MDHNIRSLVAIQEGKVLVLYQQHANPIKREVITPDISRSITRAAFTSPDSGTILDMSADYLPGSRSFNKKSIIVLFTLKPSIGGQIYSLEFFDSEFLTLISSKDIPSSQIAGAKSTDTALVRILPYSHYVAIVVSNQANTPQS